jgi:hypothetical protein
MQLFLRNSVKSPQLVFFSFFCLQILFLDDYGDLEPSISGKIMELYHKDHHNAYVTGYNTAIEKLQEAQHPNDIAAQIALKPLNGGGHLNHTPVEFQTGFSIMSFIGDQTACRLQHPGRHPWGLHLLGFEVKKRKRK